MKSYSPCDGRIRILWTGRGLTTWQCLGCGSRYCTDPNWPYPTLLERRGHVGPQTRHRFDPAKVVDSK
jgi:hypothetical protein